MPFYIPALRFVLAILLALLMTQPAYTEAILDAEWHAGMESFLANKNFSEAVVMRKISANMRILKNTKDVFVVYGPVNELPSGIKLRHLRFKMRQLLPMALCLACINDASDDAKFHVATTAIRKNAEFMRGVEFCSRIGNRESIIVYALNWRDKADAINAILEHQKLQPETKDTKDDGEKDLPQPAQNPNDKASSGDASTQQ